jgi:hypothetical protein
VETDSGSSFFLLCQRYAGFLQETSGSSLLVFLLVSLCSAPLAARAPFDLDLPADSPVWWTLTDSLAPAELRATLRDRAAHLARYRNAFEAGLVDGLPEQGLRRLSFYVNTEQTPELTPMWRAFDVWADSFTELYGRKVLARHLARYRVTSETVDKLLRLADEHVRLRESVATELEPKLLEFVQVQREVILSRAAPDAGQDGGSVVERALATGQLEPLIVASGESRARIEELYRAWKVNPAAESATTSLPRLESGLTPDEWVAFRRYLLERVVPGIGPVMDFDAGRSPGAREQ